MTTLDKLKSLYEQLLPIQKKVFEMVNAPIDQIKDIEKAIEHCERIIKANEERKNTKPVTIPHFINLPNVSHNVPPKERPFCICGTIPEPGDTFYYQSRYSDTELEGEVKTVNFDNIISKNGTSYSFREIRIKPKWIIREEKLNNLFGDEENII